MHAAHPKAIAAVQILLEGLHATRQRAAGGPAASALTEDWRCASLRSRVPPAAAAQPHETGVYMIAGLACSARGMPLLDASGPLAAQHVESTPHSKWRALITLWLMSGTALQRLPQ